MSDDLTQWMVSFASRNNLLNSDIPHIPILVEDIPAYISSKDYEESVVKTIVTIGGLVPETESDGTLLSLTPENDSKFPISFRRLNIEDIYVRNSNNTYCAIWEKHYTFKVYGTLCNDEEEVVLEVSFIVPVQDVSGTLKTLKLLHGLTRCKLEQYRRTPEQNHLLEIQWDKMKEEEKRLVVVDVTQK